MSDEFSPETVRRAVGHLRPEWIVRDVTAADEGTDAVYFVTAETPDGSRDCVLKICEFLDPEEFRPEPHLMRLLDRRTSIPVPGVLGAVDSAASETPRSAGGETVRADRDDLPVPFYLMERRDGEVWENGARDIPTESVERIARDAGRYLGELNGLGEFEAFGSVRLGRDTDHDRTGVELDGRTLTTADSAADSWRAWVAENAESCLSDLGDRFADLEPDLRAFVESRLNALDGSFDPVLGDTDYRLGNLLIDPESGETRAALDWGNNATVAAGFDLVATEQYLSGWASHDDPRRERVRAALREGYEETNHVERDPGFERRRELYLAVTRMWPLVCFSLWYGDMREAERERIAEKHRRAVLELVE